MYFITIEKEVAVNPISLQIALTMFNGYLQRLFLTVDSTKFILRPVDALQLAEDYRKIKKFKWRLDHRTVSYLDDKESEFYLNICNDIISNYRELLKTEMLNGGNLAIATKILMDDDEEPFDLEIFNYNGHPIDKDIIKNLKGV